MNQEEQLEIAAAAHAKLEEMHERFMSSVSGLGKPKVNGAEFGVLDSELFCVCLGVTMKAPHRLVAEHGAFVGVEYTFFAELDGEKVAVWSIYLMPDAGLYADPAKTDVICDASNPYMPSQVAPRLASALMASRILAART